MIHASAVIWTVRYCTNVGLSCKEQGIQSDFFLFSLLEGVPFPLNSVGVLPVEYLNNTEEYIAENLFMNSKQILEQYEVKEFFRKKTSLVFRPFRSLTGMSSFHSGNALQLLGILLIMRDQDVITF